MLVSGLLQGFGNPPKKWSKWAMIKTLFTFHSSGWLIGIPTMAMINHCIDMYYKSPKKQQRVMVIVIIDNSRGRFLSGYYVKSSLPGGLLGLSCQFPGRWAPRTLGYVDFFRSAPMYGKAVKFGTTRFLEGRIGSLWLWIPRIRPSWEPHPPK